MFSTREIWYKRKAQALFHLRKNSFLPWVLEWWFNLTSYRSQKDEITRLQSHKSKQFKIDFVILTFPCSEYGGEEVSTSRMEQMATGQVWCVKRSRPEWENRDRAEQQCNAVLEIVELRIDRRPSWREQRLKCPSSLVEWPGWIWWGMITSVAQQEPARGFEDRAREIRQR